MYESVTVTMRWLLPATQVGGVIASIAPSIQDMVSDVTEGRHAAVGMVYHKT